MNVYISIISYDLLLTDLLTFFGNHGQSDPYKTAALHKKVLSCIELGNVPHGGGNSWSPHLYEPLFYTKKMFDGEVGFRVPGHVSKGSRIKISSLVARPLRERGGGTLMY